MVTAVAFHFNVQDRRDYVCRLLRKALRAGAKVAVTADEHELSELDRRLWISDPLEFLPHWRGVEPARLPERMAATPVVLVERATPERGHAVLVNLRDTVPEGYGAFERVIEIVGQDDAGRVAARQRWKHYLGAGLMIERHEVRS